jgi:hypothetical protein
MQLFAKAGVGLFELGPPSGIVPQECSLVEELDELELIISADHLEAMVSQSCNTAVLRDEPKVCDGRKRGESLFERGN